jgi:hypothetical protein
MIEVNMKKSLLVFGGAMVLALLVWLGVASQPSSIAYLTHKLGIGCSPTNAVDVVGSGVVTGGLGVGTNAPSAGVQIMGAPTGLSWSLNGRQAFLTNGLFHINANPQASYHLYVGGAVYCGNVTAGSLTGSTGSGSNSVVRLASLVRGSGAAGIYLTNGATSRLQWQANDNSGFGNSYTNALLDQILVDATSNAPISALAFSVNSGARLPTETMRIVGDKVGIGTNAPSTALHVVGIATVSSNVVAGGVFSSGGNAGKSVTNTWYSVSSDLLTVVTNVQKIHGGLMTSWTVGGVETMVAP